MRKKFTLGRVAAGLFAALWLVPQSIHADDCQFIPNLFPGQAADRTETVVNATVTYGESGPNSYDNMHLINQLASTNENVVKTYSEREGYNAKVFFVGVGTADVTYTETIQRSSCTGVEQTIHYTVEKGTPTAYFKNEAAMPVTTYNLSIDAQGGGSSSGGGGAEGTIIGGNGEVITGGGGGGEVTPSYWTPSVYITIKNFDAVNNRFYIQQVTTGITYQSSNPAVATIDANGKVTPTGVVGETTISAYWPGDDNWKAVNPSYTLVVKKTAPISFSPNYGTDTIDKVIKLTPIIGSEDVQIDSWTTSNPTVATVDDQGNVTTLKVGTAYIYARFDGNEEYHPRTASYQLTVVKKAPNIHFTQSSVKLELNATPYVFPALIKPEDLTGPCSYRSSDPSVATVDPVTGAITIVGVGGTQIQFLFDQGETPQDPKYLPEIARLNLTVTTSNLYIGGKYVMASNPDVFGDGSVMYEYENGQTNLTLTNLDYDAKGGTFIQATDHTNLNIYVVGNCRIKNALNGILNIGALYIWCENKKDSIFIEASNMAIQTGGLKVIDSYLFATGGVCGIHTNEFYVWAGGYIFASGNTEAIHFSYFMRGAADMGGIEVLTKGVTCIQGAQGGFFTDVQNKVKAKYVEIGKIPLPLENDKVKDIDFTEENPYDNLDVVFSESKEDKFNEETKEIEISTTTSDAAVDGALELYVTCSSEWLKLLPGVLVFDVPAGSGELAIQCELEEGYKLQVAIEGKGKVSVTQTNNGWAVIQYEVLEQTHVIVYLQEASPSLAPAKAQAQKNDGPSVGASIKAIKITPGSVDKYYVFGSFNGWEANESYRLTLNEGAGTTEYMIELPLTTTDQFKVVKVDGENKTWYPDLVPNYGANGEIQEDGNYTIYFRPNGDGGQDWFYNVIYVAKVTPSGIESPMTNEQSPSIKVLRNGQIFILRGEKVYTLQGMEVILP